MVERGSCAEDVLFPEAIIDKLMGDEVMALYLPDVLLRIDHDRVPSLMADHARGLLEAFVGNIGERALYDFTAVAKWSILLRGCRNKRQAEKACSPSGWPTVCQPPLEPETK